MGKNKFRSYFGGRLASSYGDQLGDKGILILGGIDERATSGQRFTGNPHLQAIAGWPQMFHRDLRGNDLEQIHPISPTPGETMEIKEPFKLSKHSPWLISFFYRVLAVH